MMVRKFSDGPQISEYGAQNPEHGAQTHVTSLEAEKANLKTKKKLDIFVKMEVKIF